MKIKDLKEDYPLIYEAALRNQEAGGGKRDDSVDLGEARFSWASSSEGGDFWNSVYVGNFEAAKYECPHLFIQQGPSHTIEVLPPGTCVFLFELEDEYDARIGAGTVKGATIDESGCIRYLVKQGQGAVERWIGEADVHPDFNDFYEKVKEVCSNYKIIELQQKNEQ